MVINKMGNSDVGEQSESQTFSEIKIFIIDDSMFFRTNIAKVIALIPGMIIVGSARNGLDALKQLDWVKPDVILLDFFMPKMDGIQTLKEIMKRTPTPTIIITAADKSEYADLYFEALQLGAFDIITKPSGEDALNLEKIKCIIEDRIRFAIKMPPQVLNVATRIPPKKPLAYKKEPLTSRAVDAQVGSLVVIGASAGGPKAIFKVLSTLHYVPNLAICVVQHMPENFTKSLANRIDMLAEYHAKEAEDGELLKTGSIFVAPGNRHMELVEKNGRICIEVNQKARIRACRPSIDLFIRSALKFFGPDR